MESETFRSRLLKLLQKSRQAFRLYSSMGKTPRGIDGSEFTDMQAAEWRSVNAELVRHLSGALERSASVSHKELASHVFLLRERFQDDFRSAESELRSQQKELVRAAESGDFARAAMLSRELVARKARVQATQAAHHELEDLIVKSKLSQPEIMLTPETELPEPEKPLAMVIPLRQKRASS